MNSRTSRPRSPTRQITFTSAAVERAIMPISEDLPTPEPAKMPRRWPRPHGTSASKRPYARAKPLLDGGPRQRGRRRRGGGAGRTRRRDRRPRRSAPPSASTTRPSSSSPTGARNCSPVAVTGCPGRSHASRRAASAACASRGSPPPRRARRRAATGVDVAELPHLGLDACRLDDQADQVRDAAVADVQVGAVERLSEALEPLTKSQLLLHRFERTRSSLVSTRASTSPTRVRRIAPPRPTRRSSCTSRCSMPPSAPATSEPRSASRRGRRGARARVTRSRSTIVRSAPRTTSSSRPATPRRRPASTRSAICSASSTACALDALGGRPPGHAPTS